MKYRLKKLSSILISAAMLISLLSIPAMAAGNPTITVGDGSVDVSGGTQSATVPVSISGNTGFASLKLTFSVPDGITVTNVSSVNGSSSAIPADAGMLLQSNLGAQAYTDSGDVIVVLAGAQDVTEDGVLFWVTYDVSRTAAAGSNTLTVQCEELYSVADLSTNLYGSVTTQNGTLTVSKTGAVVPAETTVPPEATGTAATFTDVTSGAYYAEAVSWAVAQNITTGTTATTFSPEASCTRAQAVTFLWRAAGSPSPASKINPFNDVTANDYYYDAVLWAVEQGITSGTGATTFSPNLVCSRGQIVTFLYRQAGQPAVGGTSFADVDSGAYYASAVAWAVAKNITSGTGSTTFSPESDCSRGQIVTFLYRAAA